MKTLEDLLPRQAAIVGCGDVGQRVARRLRALGGEVTAIARHPPDMPGLLPLACDLDREPPDLPQPLVFWFAPPPASGDEDPRLRRWLDTRPPARRIVYISTSGVYGDCGGRWIDEDEPARPLSARAHRRLNAEALLWEHAAAGECEVMVLRVPGIYGPGRLPRERLQQGLPVVREEESPYTNRIHAEDLAQAALHAAAWGRPGRVYNVADGQPTTMCDYFTRCAALLGLPPPPQVSMEEARQRFTPAMWSFMEESKRLRTERLRGELRFTPAYPDLASGLPACF
ncbi:SDR family oxidoreductase [Solimonas sp. K1W22B-7]|uniref:SDR family oxidoreductase n=1 Tax=Solimonas sp. K1W22B-7 TaxID=2303331 RepID=UPI000E3368E5|nr:SDR family oxidoreductase [Solimonas sp. K1W22B-7]AXQ31233.1 SDR family oxidoreductase [Solimonas sp. K1W22B-7]